MTEQWIKARGVITVDKKEKRVALSVGFDFVNYYVWLLENSLKQRFSYPRHGGHVSIALPLHGKIDFDFAKRFDKQRVEFEYSPDIVISPKNFWLRVRCKEIEEIKKELRIKDSAGFRGLHLTVANKKEGIRKFQKGMIEIR